ncbi:MAG: hypothetical protein KME17_03340 [Cyanosarcina radialis HA8281-LM2]|jgi:hypothetical protein|nr:hypothetical protein [Cyanosarcina radialis HA8281-LM2]
MANLSEATLTTVFDLQRRVLQLIDRATAFEFTILQQYGETEATISDLEILHNVRERATSYYTRLYRLLLQIVESQPVASSDTLNLLARSVRETQAIVDAGDATVREVQQDWNLP